MPFVIPPLRALLLSAALLMITGCASLLAPPILAGDTEATVLGRLGPPTHRYQDGNAHLLEYATAPFGQRTWMARIGANGRLESYRQVLSTPVFATIIVGKSNSDDVLRTIGAPMEVSSLPRLQQQIWTYAYKESDVWNSLMHVYFDQQGIVRQLQSGPDMRFDPDGHFPGLR